MTTAATTTGDRGDARSPRRYLTSSLRIAAPWFMVTLALLPFVPLALWSMSARWFYPGILPEELSGRAWGFVFSSTSGVRQSLYDSIAIALVVTVIAALIGLSAGRAMGLYRFRGKRLVEFLILAPAIVPPLAVSTGIQVVFIKYGLADTIQGVILVHLIPTVPYVTLVMASVYANYEIEYEDQARVLGASPLKVFWHITLRAVIPGLVVAALFAFLISWSEYILTLLIGGGQVQTLPLLLFAFANSDPSVASALAIFFIAPAVVILIFTSKYLSGTRSTLGGVGRL